VRGKRRVGSSTENPTSQQCGLIIESNIGNRRRKLTRENSADIATRRVKCVNINVKSGEYRIKAVSVINTRL